MVTVSASIMAHPSREAMVADLLDRLDRPVPVTWDERNDRYDTGVRAIRAHDPAADWHVVIQDDVLPVPDLLAGIEAALAHVPAECPASFYIGRVRPFSQRVERAVSQAGDSVSFIVMDGIYWGPCIAVPTAAVPDVSAWWDRSRVTNYDRRLSTWFARRNIRCWYSWPSLVDHRGVESLAHERASADRRAHRVAPGSALDVDWTLGAAVMHRTGRLDRERQARARAAEVG